MMFALKKARSCLDTKSCWSLYNSFILPHLNYTNSIWGSASVTQLHSLSIIQNKAIKTIKKLPTLFPTINLYSEKLLSLNHLCKYNVLLLIYKIKHSFVRCNIELVQAQTIHSFNTRNRENYYLNRPRTELAFRNVFYSGIMKFNALPHEIKTETSISIFKRKLRELVYQNCV